MAPRVVHTKVDAIPDDPVQAAQGRVLPSDWNADHTITGLGSTDGLSFQSLTLNGATLGSNTLAVLGSSDFSKTTAGVTLTISKTSTATVADSALNIHTATSGAGRMLQFFLDNYSTTIPVAYFNDGAHFYTRLGITSSGTFSSANISAPTSGLGSTPPYMIGAWGDVDGPMFISRLTPRSVINTRHWDFIGNDATGLFQSTDSPRFEFSILRHGTLAWGQGLTQLSQDAFLGRGNAAATIQFGGPDAFAPVAQHISTQNVAASVSYAVTAATAAGNATLTFGQVIPPDVFVGMTITARVPSFDALRAMATRSYLVPSMWPASMRIGMAHRELELELAGHFICGSRQPARRDRRRMRWSMRWSSITLLRHRSVLSASRVVEIQSRNSLSRRTAERPLALVHTMAGRDCYGFPVRPRPARLSILEPFCLPLASTHSPTVPILLGPRIPVLSATALEW